MHVTETDTDWTGEARPSKWLIKGKEYDRGAIALQFMSGIDCLVEFVFRIVARLGERTQLSPNGILSPDKLIAGLHEEEKALGRLKGYPWTIWDDMMYAQNRTSWRYLGNEETAMQYRADPQKYPYHDVLFRGLEKLRMDPALWSTALAYLEGDKDVLDARIASWIKIEGMEEFFKIYLEFDHSEFMKEFEKELLEIGRYLSSDT
ncbi:hypothetical protein BJ508DRAFT_326398 [Ascobolus immersus RN42]|uniref:Uncharacterized protein n=1 Tax=Ascobolus immersus RN42 TaxID=1160509 RepID=A0A3N4I5Z2_ASCIM|nr:hypothetical protein BJ508DRAFT_326398 [Ascobolus immersus RN42]